MLLLPLRSTTYPNVMQKQSKLRGEDKPQVLWWLEKNARKHTAPENQNEMLQLMVHHVLRRVLKDIYSSPFLAVMVDETTDMSNTEQLTLVLRWISDDFMVSEEFLGLFSLSSVDAQSIVNVMTCLEEKLLHGRKGLETYWPSSWCWKSHTLQSPTAAGCCHSSQLCWQETVQGQSTMLGTGYALQEHHCQSLPSVWTAWPLSLERT